MEWVKEYRVKARHVPQHFDRNQGRTIAAHYLLEATDRRGLRYVVRAPSFREARAHLVKNMLRHAQEIGPRDLVHFTFDKEWEKKT